MDHFPIYQGLSDYAANPIKDHLLTLSLRSQSKRALYPSTPAPLGIVAQR